MNKIILQSKRNLNHANKKVNLPQFSFDVERDLANFTAVVLNIFFANVIEHQREQKK